MRKHLIFFLLFLAGCIFVDTSPNRCYHLWDPSQKNECLFMVASETSNISKCGEINESSVAERCYTLLLGNGIAENYSICMKLSGAGMDECFSRLAVRTNDSSMCMKVNSSYSRDNCLSGIAITLGRPDICESIALNVSRNTCKNQIYPQLAIKNKDAAFCRLIIADNSQAQLTAVDACIVSMAKELNDTTYCNQVSTEFTRQFCLTGRIDPASCDTISDPQGRQVCHYIAAVYSKDPSACASMPSGTLRDSCYLQLASDMKNPQICSYISLESMREQCLQISQS